MGREQGPCRHLEWGTLRHQGEDGESKHRIQTAKEPHREVMGPLGWHSREAEGRQESVPKQGCGRFKRRKMLGEPQSCLLSTLPWPGP